jgi:hypothetical protein
MFKLCEKMNIFFCILYIFAFSITTTQPFLTPPSPPTQTNSRFEERWDLTRVSKPSLVHSNILNLPPPHHCSSICTGHRIQHLLRGSRVTLARSPCLHPHKYLSLLVVAREGGCVLKTTDKVVFFLFREVSITRYSCYACVFHMFASS